MTNTAPVPPSKWLAESYKLEETVNAQLVETKSVYLFGNKCFFWKMIKVCFGKPIFLKKHKTKHANKHEQKQPF